MQRIDAYNGLFQPGNPATNTKGTIVTFSWLNAVQEEIANTIEAAGIKLDPDLTKQLATAIQSGKLAATTAGGTADAITAAFTPSVTALIDGMVLRVRAAAANATNAPTFTPAKDVIAPKTIVKHNGKALAAGDIAGAGHWLLVQYDAAIDKWVLANPAGMPNLGLTTVEITDGDFDTVAPNFLPGVLYYMFPAVTNMPVAGKGWVVEVIQRAGTFIQYRATSGDSTVACRRTYYPGTGWREWVPVSSVVDTGVPLLSIIWSVMGVEPGFLDISQDNGLLSRSAYPNAWAKISTLPSSMLLSDSAWQTESAAHGGVCGKFSTGDGSTTFRVPLIGKRFIRATGVGLSAGTAQGDAIRDIVGSFRGGDSASGTAPPTGVFSVLNTEGGYGSGGVLFNRVQFKAAGVVPTADENRPVAVAFTPLLKMYGAVSDASTLDIAAMVQGLAAKLDASAAIGGAGVIWMNVTASRALSTTYTNTSGRPIMVNVSATSSAAGAVLSLTVNGIAVPGSGGPAANNPMHAVAIVPNGATYLASVSAGTGTLTTWNEMR